jgi:diaminopimelate decarboxylase
MKLISDCLEVNEAGHLTIGGIGVPALAQEYGTPLYIMDEDKIRDNCNAYMTAMQKHYPGFPDKQAVAYASKAFACKRMYAIVHDQGLLADVASGGELYTALSGNTLPAGRIIFHGNNKTDEELRYALKEKVHRIVANGPEELERISSIAGELNVRAKVSLRLSPGTTDTAIHTAVQTGILDSKFGIPIETGAALEAVRLAEFLKNIEFKGIHCHLGSPIYDLDVYVTAIHKMTAFMSENNVPLNELNIGGGFAVSYLPGEKVHSAEEYIEAICRAVKDAAQKHGSPLPKIIIEPGRAIVADAGITVYTAGSVKEIPGVRTYVSVDGGMTDNPRYMLYGSKHDITAPERALEPKTQNVALAGRCCECELLGMDMPIQPVRPGDLVAVLNTGAYNYSMASNYNRIPRPPVVMVSGGKSYVAVRRETWEDVARLDV